MKPIPRFPENVFNDVSSFHGFTSPIDSIEMNLNPLPFTELHEMARFERLIHENPQYEKALVRTLNTSYQLY